MPNKEIVSKLQLIATFLGLGNNKKLKSILKNLENLPPSEDISVETNLKKFENTIYDKASSLIKTDRITPDKYGQKFFNLIEAVDFQTIKSLLLEKKFRSKKVCHYAPTTQTLYKIPAQKQPETQVEPLDLSIQKEPLDLSKANSFAFSSKA